MEKSHSAPSRPHPPAPSGRRPGPPGAARGAAGNGGPGRHPASPVLFRTGPTRTRALPPAAAPVPALAAGAAGPFRSLGRRDSPLGRSLASAELPADETPATGGRRREALRGRGLLRPFSRRTSSRLFCPRKGQMSCSFRNLGRRDSALRSSLASVELSADEIPATGGRRRRALARADWSASGTHAEIFPDGAGKIPEWMGAGCACHAAPKRGSGGTFGNASKMPAGPCWAPAARIALAAAAFPDGKALITELDVFRPEPENPVLFSARAAACLRRAKEKTSPVR